MKKELVDLKREVLFTKAVKEFTDRIDKINAKFPGGVLVYHSGSTDDGGHFLAVHNPAVDREAICVTWYCNVYEDFVGVPYLASDSSRPATQLNRYLQGMEDLLVL